MPSSIIVPALAAEFSLGVVGQAVATLAIRALTTIAVSSLIAREMADTPREVGQQGGRVQLPPATDNKLPVVYGSSWVSPTIVDVKISEDQQTMWYVLAFAEATDSGTVSFGSVYWDDKRLLFDPANPSKIWGWYVEGDGTSPADNTIVTGVADKINMWFYRNGSALTGTTHYCVNKTEPYGGSQQPTNVLAKDIVPGWTDAQAMTNTVFAVVQVKYDQDHGVTGLGQIRAQVNNTLNKPGSVMVDYLQNSRYGAGVPTSFINTASFAQLDTYSTGTISIGGQTVQRYSINGYVETNNDCLTNLVNIANSADSWLQWNESRGQWGVIINQTLEEGGGSTSTMRVVGMNNILGGVQITPLDLNSTYNSVNVQFPNGTIRDQNDFRLLSISPSQRFTNEPNNQLSLQLPLINNDYQATYIGWKRLYNSRNDISINFTMDYSGIQIDAGDIIAVQHDWYGWVAGKYGDGTYPGKPFRVTQVRESKDNNGFLTAQISAIAYFDTDYQPGEHYATTQQFSGLTDPQYISKPPAPTIPTDFVNSSTAAYIVRGEVPELGNVTQMEFWYSVKGSEITSNNYFLYSAQNYGNGPVYPKQAVGGATFYEEVQTNDLPKGTYYWRTRARGENTVSEFSDASSAFVWEVAGKAIDGTQINDGTISGSKVITGDPDKTGTAQGGGFFDTLGPIAGVGLAAASMWGLYKYYDQEYGKDQDKGGNGNSFGTEDIINTFWPSNENPQVGDQVTYTADATPPQPEPYYTASNEGFSDWGGGDWSENDWNWSLG